MSITKHLMALGALAVSLGLCLEAAVASWQPNTHGATKQATAGTDSGALNGQFTVDPETGTATTNIRARCVPCPTCEWNPYASFEYTLRCKDAAGRYVGNVVMGHHADCHCPSDLFQVGVRDVATATSMEVSVKVKCGCCGKAGLIDANPDPDDYSGADQFPLDPLTLP